MALRVILAAPVARLERFAMKLVFQVLVAGACSCIAVPVVHAAPCLIVTLTGSMGGPPTFNGLAGPGTLVQYGDDSNNCTAVKMQFDAGRGTNMRLSQVGVPEWQLNAIFFTHMHTRSHRGVCRHSSVALALQRCGAEDRRGLQLRYRVAAGVHHELQEVCHCILPMHSSSPARLPSAFLK